MTIQRSLALEILDENNHLLKTWFPPQFYYLFQALFEDMTKPQILAFINLLLITNGSWTMTKINQLKRRVQQKNISAIVIDKNQLGKSTTAVVSRQGKWGIIYEGKLHNPCNPTITLQNLKELQKTSPDTLVAIVTTTEQQPSPEEVKVSELQIVYFDE